ncbi:MAG: hypothetical protein IJU76_04055 [Desulfovibrionaceae bacterium]|nr:hypothetical protein [Desulfovibrionaceae bacterium]
MQRRANQKEKKGGWIFAFALGVLTLLIMLLVHVWVNMERVDTSYLILNAQNEIVERRDHLAKLEVERERLLTPHELRQKAIKYGMHEPFVGQIRLMER